MQDEKKGGQGVVLRGCAAVHFIKVPASFLFIIKKEKDGEETVKRPWNNKLYFTPIEVQYWKYVQQLNKCHRIY